ncbi:MAG: DUF3320 domain-containing protein [Oscillospiraceae bacterium]
MGYKIKCNIGCSEFKVDIGIIDPKNEEEYLLGILLDGQNNKNSSTARDRFVLQPSVLQGLGWNIIRVWTLDWLDDSERVLRSIKAAIENIPTNDTIKKTNDKPVTYASIEFEKEDISQLVSTACRPYVSTPIISMGTSEEYYLPQNKKIIQKLADEIIFAEAPISRKLLMKKVLSAWAITRGGSKVESIFLDAINDLQINTTIDEDRIFIWKKDQAPEAYSKYRIDSDDTAKRSIDEIASEEIGNAINEVLCEQISLSETDLIRETAKKFGYSRIGGIIENSVGYVCP